MTVNPLNRYRTDGLASQSPQRLLILLYQRLSADLARAEACLVEDRPAAAHSELIHAQEIVTELRLALDAQAWPEGAGLAQLYRYLEHQLVMANVTKSAIVVGECRQLVDPLTEAWEGAYRAVRTARPEPVGVSLT